MKNKQLIDQAVEMSLNRNMWCTARLYEFVLEGKDPNFSPQESHRLVVAGLAISSSYAEQRIFSIQKVQDHDRDRTPVIDRAVKYAFRVAPDVVDYIRRINSEVKSGP